MKSLKILYLINHAGKAGTEKYVLNLVKYIKQKGDECVFAYNEGGLLSEQMADMGITSYQVEMKNPFDIKAAKQIAKICKDEKIDIIHTQYPRENYIAILSKNFGSGAKVIYTCHLTLAIPKVWAIMNSVMLKGCDRIISVCNNGKEILCGAGAPKNKIDVIFNGIDKIYPEKDKTAIRELGIDDNTFVFITLSRLSFEKGLFFLIRSAAKLKTLTDKPFVVLIAGDGEQKDELSAFIKEQKAEDYVKLLGYRNDGAALLSGSDVFVNSASCNEALSFAILEGLSHSLPAVATAIGGNGDIVNEKNGCGILVPFDDDEKMASAFLKLMEDKAFYKKCSEGALSCVKTTFSLDKVLGETYKVYKNI